MSKHVVNREKVSSAEMNDLYGGRGLLRRWPYYSEGDGVPPFTMMVETEMEAGAYTGLHTQNDQHEFIYILEGSIRFTIDGETHDVKAGDALLAPAGSSFSVANPGVRPIRYLAVKCRTQE